MPNWRDATIVDETTEIPFITSELDNRLRTRFEQAYLDTPMLIPTEPHSPPRFKFGELVKYKDPFYGEGRGKVVGVVDDRSPQNQSIPFLEIAERTITESQIHFYILELEVNGIKRLVWFKKEDLEGEEAQ